ncbi:MAG TPA: GGDEF and EAL domain-containing protein, partial [Hyphomicrobiaceae bacterium]|nr:GGDEF and EAL domain-containing protein [Hyphomicrobiaceae bacterium]
PEHITRRQQAIGGDATVGAGKAYRVQYRFMPGGRRNDVSLWLEDHGQWWPDADGRPARASGVVRIINERYREEQRLLYRSDHDELTGHLNRIRLTEALSAVIGRAQRMRQPCAFLIVAVNNLAVINETFGFDVGDEVIAATGRVIKKSMRGGDVIGRYSSNKFGIILNDCGPGAMRIASERFMKAVREATISTTLCQLSATTSIGGVLIPDHAKNVHQAISHALQALHSAKAKRGECVCSYEPSPQRESARKRNITIADEVISALDENRMQLALQPIVSTATRLPALYECLLRMAKADGTMVSAGEFIQMTEQLGLSRLIDRRTLELAVDLVRTHPELRLSLNVSGLTCNDHDWLVSLHRLTGGRRQLTERLTIEITETAAIDDLDQSIAFVDTLKEFGCRVAIDDFGAGYTSFKNLKHLAVDMVKIDGAFVKNLSQDASDRVFIKTMVELASTFGMETVAEWVGDEVTARILADTGITYLQGFHFGKPQLAGALPQLGAQHTVSV